MKLFCANCRCKARSINTALIICISNKIRALQPDIAVFDEIVIEGTNFQTEISNLGYDVRSSRPIKGRNQVVIAVKAGIKVGGPENCNSDSVMEPDYLQLIVEKGGQKYNIIGFRMLVGGEIEKDFKERKEIFDNFVCRINLPKSAITIIIGDFNNGRYLPSVERYKGLPQEPYNYQYIERELKSKLKLEPVDNIKSRSNSSLGSLHEDHCFISEEAFCKVRSYTFQDWKCGNFDHRYLYVDIA